MRSTIIIAAVASLAIGSSFAQNANPPAAPPSPAAAQPGPPASPDPGKAALPRIDLTPVQRPEPGNPAIKTTEGNNPGAPASGANSFTEGQAKSRIEAKGYTNISLLKKDEKGVWRGTAMKGGKSVQVSLDFQGNVVVD